MTVTESAVPEAIEKAGVAPDDVVGLGIDFTSCTVLPVTEDGTPLCNLDRWRGRPGSHPWSPRCLNW